MKKLQKYFEDDAEETNRNVEDMWAKYNSIEVSEDETEESETKKPVKKKNSPKKETEEIPSPDDLSAGRLAVAKKPELQGLCRYHELKIGGKNDELRDRLREFAVKRDRKGKKKETPKSISERNSDFHGKSKVTPPKKVAKGKPKEEENEDAEEEPVEEEEKKKKVSPKKGKKVPPKVLEKIAPVQHRARKNKYGNYVLANYGIVMDEETQTTAIGLQADDGSILPLDDEKIDICKMLKIPFQLPDNLDTEADLDQTQVDGIEDRADEQIAALAKAAKKKGKQQVVDENEEPEEEPEIDDGAEESEVEEEESDIEIVD